MTAEISVADVRKLTLQNKLMERGEVLLVACVFPITLIPKLP